LGNLPTLMIIQLGRGGFMRLFKLTSLILLVLLVTAACDLFELVPNPESAARMADANVEYVRAIETAPGTWTFHVTVRHPDSGWEDYADGWDVALPDGTVIKPDASSSFTRLLLHPHETEQPFTRSQSGILIPADVTQVTVRAHDLVDGFGGAEIVVDLMVESGAGFEVQRAQS
jgi:hypothetical protein